MEKNGLFEKNKNNILNLGIVILALFIAFKIYKGIEEQMDSLTRQKDNELKKNEAVEKIAGLEKKIDGYKKVFVKKDPGVVIDTISVIAKKCAVKVVSIKPAGEEARADYIKSSFSITIRAPDYHALGNFVSQIESYQDVFLVDEIKISSAIAARAAEGAGKELEINLKISTISYLQ